MPKKLTTKDFIERATTVHGDRYDYSLVEYNGSRDNISIICSDHGVFRQAPNTHLLGGGCKKCGLRNRPKSRSLGISGFLKRAKEAHGDRYDYSLANYSNAGTKIKIICKEHGEFLQTPSDHMAGKGCRKCGLKKRGMSGRNSIEKTLSSFKAAHGDKYNYSLVEPRTSKEKVKIICPLHGIFEQAIYQHSSGHGCFECGKLMITEKKTRSADVVIDDFIAVHGDKYDYSQINYKSAHRKVKIICQKHGEFKQTPASHKTGRGCPKCAGRKKETDVIRDFKLVHGDKYDYSKVEYKTSMSKVKIICPDHGMFKQRPNNHLSGQGCPKCPSTTSSIEETMIAWLDSEKIRYINSDRDLLKKQEIDIFLSDYNIGIECNGIYWHSTRIGRDKAYHLNKTKECEQNGIRLLHFWDFEINGKLEIVKSIVLNAIGKTPNKIYARKLKIDNDVSTEEARVFCEQNHIHGFRGGKHKVGLRNTDGELMSLMITGSDGEMVRFVSKINTNVVGGFSRLLKHSPVTYSFVDRRLYTGSGYLKNGFVIDGETPPNYFYEKDGIYIGTRQQFQKHKLSSKIDDFDRGLSEVENMNRNGFYQIFDCGNYRMVLDEKEVSKKQLT